MEDRANGAALAHVAAAIADASRATMLLALLDGRAWTATELAKYAGIARSTATEHLHTLVRAELIEEKHQGRHRYLRIANPSIAALLESLAVSTTPAPPSASLRSVRVDQEMRAARSCYDHLAGRLGVGVHDALRARGYLDVTAPLHLSPAGEWWCAELGVDLDALARAKRPKVLLCVDWTERREHLAGALGAALLERFLALGWLTRIDGSRAVRVTDVGRAAFAERLGLAAADAA